MKTLSSLLLLSIFIVGCECGKSKPSPKSYVDTSHCIHACVRRSIRGLNEVDGETTKQLKMLCESKFSDGRTKCCESPSSYYEDC